MAIPRGVGVSVGSGEHKVGYQLFRKPRLPSPQPLLYVPSFPIPTQENGGWGRGKEGGLTFFVTRQFLRFRRKADNHGYRSMAWQTLTKIHQMGMSFPHLKSHESEPLDLKTHGPVPGHGTNCHSTQGSDSQSLCLRPQCRS